MELEVFEKGQPIIVYGELRNPKFYVQISGCSYVYTKRAEKDVLKDQASGKYA